MRASKIALVLLIIAILLSGCAQNTAPAYQNISTKDLQWIIQNEKDFVLVDVREPYELEETGYLPGAVNIPVGQVEQKLNTLPKTGKMILYCRTGRRSADAAKFLAGKGYTNVYNLEGGIVAWPYEKTQPKK